MSDWWVAPPGTGAWGRAAGAVAELAEAAGSDSFACSGSTPAACGAPAERTHCAENEREDEQRDGEREHTTAQYGVAAGRLSCLRLRWCELGEGISHR